MCPGCDCCGDNVEKLKQQVSVMRKEIKNLRQMLDTATRTHQKQMLSIKSTVSKTGFCQPQDSRPPPSPKTELEQGKIQTLPIGHIRSCFSEKNGTPRQPTVCGPSRAELQLELSVFNNPEHALIGLEQFSHIWVIFLFHKNGHLSHKAKVKPPRLNGERVGLYSTRSPHRPNALGLTLAKLDKIVGDTLHLSNIDMIAGTPVLDIKPYISDYDTPCSRKTSDLDTCHSTTDPAPLLPSAPINTHLKEQEHHFEANPNPLQCVQSHESERDIGPSKESDSTIASWIREAPVANLEVRFTPHAREELARFIPRSQSGPSDDDDDDGVPRFRFLRSFDEAVTAIRGVLSADPRSVYRRTRCQDKLFFFTLDTADITCWFGPDFAEVLRVRPFESK
ncbi:tRNA (adenine(37)-N6)-methyltransferase isoform X2 [Stigmatopora nigra]